jgi:hypothetical protein
MLVKAFIIIIIGKMQFGGGRNNYSYFYLALFSFSFFFFGCDKIQEDLCVQKPN